MTTDTTKPKHSEKSCELGACACAREVLDLRAKVATLEKFKAYVHQRLDAAGIPKHPDGPHSKEGCRIGDRLDLVSAQVATIEALNRIATLEAQVAGLRLGNDRRADHILTLEAQVKEAKQSEHDAVWAERERLNESEMRCAAAEARADAAEKKAKALEVASRDATERYFRARANFAFPDHFLMDHADKSLSALAALAPAPSKEAKATEPQRSARHAMADAVFLGTSAGACGHDCSSETADAACPTHGVAAPKPPEKAAKVACACVHAPEQHWHELGCAEIGCRCRWRQPHAMQLPAQPASETAKGEEVGRHPCANCAGKMLGFGFCWECRDEHRSEAVAEVERLKAELAASYEELESERRWAKDYCEQARRLREALEKISAATIDRDRDGKQILCGVCQEVTCDDDCERMIAVRALAPPATEAKCIHDRTRMAVGGDHTEETCLDCGAARASFVIPATEAK